MNTNEISQKYPKSADYYQNLLKRMQKLNKKLKNEENARNQ